MLGSELPDRPITGGGAVKPRTRGRFAALFLTLSIAVLVSYAAVAAATGGGGGSLQTKQQVASETKAAEGADEISQAADQYAAAPLAPRVDGRAAAVTTARTAAAALPPAGAAPRGAPTRHP